MEALLLYILRAQAHLILFGIGYLVFYRRNPIPALNRFYLLFSISMAALLPLLPSIWSIPLNNDEVAVFSLPELVIAASGAIAQTTERISVLGVYHVYITSIIVVVQLALFLWLAARLSKLASITTGRKGHKVEGMELVVLSVAHVPFSFFHWLFIPEGLDKSPAFSHILMHEKVHAQRLHSLDILLFEIFRLIFWMNPIFYLMRSELKVMHEYEADAYALTCCEKISYQQTLVEMNFRGLTVPLTNPYNVSLIKKRMLMMNKNRKHMSSTKPWLLSGALILLMVVALVFQSFKPMDTEIRETTPAITQILEQSTIQTVPQRDTAVFVVVEEMPVFQNGSEGMMKFLIENIKYPEQARKDSVQGRVFVNFIVEANGKVSNAKVLRGIGSGCDEEALRVVNLMPDWTPGRQRGKNVRVSFNLPIMFKLDNKK
ncbi:MAG: M56 family metallopeptidase [Bacteroidales bacterium]|nr:M56 family metallopeptidase [Bacteroidales bacterium]